ncbi:hypothetical protein AVEN_6248-1 [Araneus ventricosus]|uniref:HTH psq-type domain-containing protein n=1 Tax=Araneus ventricosus TaxID=182803 RepID=A0A4Y2GMQ0_ARAVE|nr:hypothetical protein AVEN_6248-1 [Araneus ventricosus]
MKSPVRLFVTTADTTSNTSSWGTASLNEGRGPPLAPPLLKESIFIKLVAQNFLLVKISGVKRKRNGLNVKQKLEILHKLDNGESARTDAEDVLNEGNTISHSAALQPVETLLDYTGQRGFDYGDITAVRKICADIRQEMNKQQKQRRIKDFLKQ